MWTVEVKELSKHYKGALTKSLDDLSIEIRQGRICGLLGPNGAGKTSLISIICGLVEPSSGSIQYLDSESLSRSFKEVRTQMGLVPQDFAFYEELTAEQNLEYFGALCDVDKLKLNGRSNELLEAVDLVAHKNKKVKHFSGGMKRRLNLILGLIHKPALLILDEPTVGIDIGSRAAIVKLLKSVKEEGTTIIYSSHDLSEAEKICEDIVLLNEGVLVKAGELKRVLDESNSTSLEQLYLSLCDGSKSEIDV